MRASSCGINPEVPGNSILQVLGVGDGDDAAAAIRCPILEQPLLGVEHRHLRVRRTFHEELHNLEGK